MDYYPIVTVVTPADTYDLTALETVKNELDIVGSESDDRLRRYISQASGEIASYCNRVFSLETVSEQFRFDLYYKYGDIRRRSLALSRTPISFVASIDEDGTALDAANYELDHDSGILMRLNSDVGSQWWARKITVVYSGGYEIVDGHISGLPQAVENACIQLVVYRWFARARDPSLRQISIPGVVERQYAVGSSADSSLPQDIRDMLEPYRNLVVA